MNNKKNKKPHLVVSIEEMDDGVEIREDVSGTLPEMSALISTYIAHFARKMSKKTATKDGKVFPADFILVGIYTAAQEGLDEFPDEDYEELPL